MGFLGIIGVAVFLIFFELKEYPIILYMGLYPVVFAFASVFGIDSSVSTGRFVVAVPAMAVYFLVIFNEESELARIIATVAAVGCIFSIGVNEFRYVYRDEPFSTLDYRVESGVNKGIFTTKARAHELPELEEYLNNIIEDDDYYSYHHGTGSPSTLYEYYKRRGIPDQSHICGLWKG